MIPFSFLCASILIILRIYLLVVYHLISFGPFSLLVCQEKVNKLRYLNNIGFDCDFN